MQDTAAGGAGMPAVYETVVSAGNADDHIAGITGLGPPGMGAAGNAAWPLSLGSPGKSTPPVVICVASTMLT